MIERGHFLRQFRSFNETRGVLKIIIAFLPSKVRYTYLWLVWVLKSNNLFSVTYKLK